MANRVTRRQFMTRDRPRRLGGLALGPQLLAACGGDDEDAAAPAVGPRVAAGTTSGSTTGPSTSTSRTTSSTARAARSTPSRRRPGSKIKYTEDFNDNNEYFAKIQPLLSKGEPIGPNIIAPTYWMAGRLHRPRVAGQAAAVDTIPNAANLLTVAAEAAVGPDRRVLPAVAVGHRRHRLQPGGHRPARSPRWRTCATPSFKGKIGMLTEMRDTIGLIAMSRGHRPRQAHLRRVPAAPSTSSRRQVQNGQIRQFTGNDYVGRPGERQLRRLHRLVRRRRPAGIDEPQHQVRHPRVRRHPVVRHDGHPQGRVQHRCRRRVDGLRVRPGQRGPDHRPSCSTSRRCRASRTSSARWAARTPPWPTTR